MKFFFKQPLYLSLFFFVPFLYFALVNFSGNKINYLIFSLISFFTVIYSFREKGFFFEKFFSIYLWLGFWFKFTLFQGLFIDSPPGGLGYFKFTNKNLNELMLLASLPFVSLTFSSILVSRFYQSKTIIKNNFFSNIYKKFRLTILIMTFFFITSITLINFKFGIYQKGLVSSIELPLFISGFFKWFYLMGSGVIISILVKYELENKNDISNSLYSLLIYESLISNITLLSRAMIFNVSAIFYGIFKSLTLDNPNIKKIKKLIFNYLIIIMLFITSVIIIDNMRSKAYFTDKKILIEKSEIFGKATNENSFLVMRILMKMKNLLRKEIFLLLFIRLYNLYILDLLE